MDGINKLGRVELIRHLGLVNCYLWGIQEQQWDKVSGVSTLEGGGDVVDPCLGCVELVLKTQLTDRRLQLPHGAA